MSISETLPVAVAAGTAAITLLGTPLYIRARGRFRRLRAERDAADQENARLKGWAAENEYLMTARLPALVTHLTHPHVPVPGLRDRALAGSSVDVAHRHVLDLVSAAVAAERERVDEAAQAVMRGATTVIQAKSLRLQTEIRELQYRFDDPLIAETAMGLDQLNEQNLRRIQATGVLCGASPGLTRADSSLSDVLKGAQSRVRAYQRIVVSNHLILPLGVVARAVEPVAVTVAELMANAVHHTHGTLPVEASCHQVESGACVVIDDAGVGMNADEVAFATRLLSGTWPVMLTELGDPPRAGFATIGRLVKQYGFSVSVDKPSPYGGVRAVVFVPGHLLTVMDEKANPPSAMAPAPRRAVPPDHGEAPNPTGGAVLPRRRKVRSQSPQPAPSAPAAVAEPADVRTPDEVSSIYRSFQTGTASGRAAVTSEHDEGNLT
ncbi:ATP-binding protein [Streptomyces sp. IBSBF 2953]|nr:ATP-binding protein [Streptomyces hayashii]